MFKAKIIRAFDKICAQIYNSEMTNKIVQYSGRFCDLENSYLYSHSTSH